jgi:hypothetical protein
MLAALPSRAPACGKDDERCPGNSPDVAIHTAIEFSSPIIAQFGRRVSRSGGGNMRSAYLMIGRSDCLLPFCYPYELSVVMSSGAITF